MVFVTPSIDSGLLYEVNIYKTFYSKTLPRESNNKTRAWCKELLCLLRRLVSQCRSLTSFSSNLVKRNRTEQRTEQRREFISAFFYFISLLTVVVCSCLSKLHRHAQSCENFLLETTRVCSRVESIYRRSKNSILPHIQRITITQE